MRPACGQRKSSAPKGDGASPPGSLRRGRPWTVRVAGRPGRGAEAGGSGAWSRGGSRRVGRMVRGAEAGGWGAWSEGTARLARVWSREHGILVATMPRSTPRPERPAAASAKPLVRVVRSPRRRKTVTAYRDGDTVVVLLPSRMTKREEAHWVTTMLERLDQRERRRRPPGDDELERRARVLAARYLDGAVEPRLVRWVGNMRSRYGSCTPDDGSIRLSDRIASYPAWVRDYVLIHELVPLAERARGFLIAKGMDDGEGSGEGSEGSVEPRGSQPDS